MKAKREERKKRKLARAFVCRVGHSALVMMMMLMSAPCGARRGLPLSISFSAWCASLPSKEKKEKKKEKKKLFLMDSLLQGSKGVVATATASYSSSSSFLAGFIPGAAWRLPPPPPPPTIIVAYPCSSSSTNPISLKGHTQREYVPKKWWTIICCCCCFKSLETMMMMMTKNISSCCKQQRQQQNQLRWRWAGEGGPPPLFLKHSPSPPSTLWQTDQWWMHVSLKLHQFALCSFVVAVVVKSTFLAAAAAPPEKRINKRKAKSPTTLRRCVCLVLFFDVQHTLISFPVHQITRTHKEWPSLSIQSRPRYSSMSTALCQSVSQVQTDQLTHDMDLHQWRWMVGLSVCL